MGLINGRIAACAVALLLWGNALYAQNTVPMQLGTEIQQLEQKLSANISPAERYNVLVGLARLRQLSGNIAIAATNWLEAAALNPNDDTALVSGAYCLAAIGEWERAASSLRPLLASGRRGASILQAQFLDACLKVWSSDDGNVAPLAALAGNPEFAALRPMIYYTLWQTLARNSGMGENAETWKTRLLAEFPKSPEARSLNPEKQKDSPVISAVQSPVWLLFPGAGGSALPVAEKPTETSKPVAATPTPTSTPASSGAVLQTGLFGREVNARAQSEALQKAGFTAIISRKTVNGTDHWAVTVPAGQDAKKTAADLKKAGFDSFPVK